MTAPVVPTPPDVQRNGADGALTAAGAVLLVPVGDGAPLPLVVCLARVHVGAHLPLDVVGGAGLGLAIAGGVRLLLGRPA